MAAKRGRSVAAKERPVHLELARRMLARDGVYGWTWPEVGMVAIFETEAQQWAYLAAHNPGARSRMDADRLAMIAGEAVPEAIPMADAAVLLGLEAPAKVKRAGKAELAAVLRAVLEEYGTADCPIVAEARRVLEAA